MYGLIFAFVFFFSVAFADTADHAHRRINAHLLLHDSQGAVSEAKRACAQFPDSKNLQVSLIRSLCEKGDEIDAIEQWKWAQTHFGVQPERYLLEMLAWGVINKGDNSMQPMVRIGALLGASATRDAKAVPLLLKEMRGSNSYLRAVAVHLAGMYGDAPLQDELLRLLKEERVWYVRLEVLKSIGQLRIKRAENPLKEIVAHPKTMAEERAQAILALVNFYENIDEKSLNELVKNKRAGLRELACDIVAHLDLQERVGEIITLLSDTSFEVRLAALNCLGLLGCKTHQQKPLFEAVKPLLNDTTPQVAITAAWLAVLLGEKEGEERLVGWINSKDLPLTRFASAALAATGKAGIPLCHKLLQETKDPYIQINLALSLIGLRSHTTLACDKIYALLTGEQKELWMWDNQMNSLFRTLAPSRVTHVEQIPHYPHVIDQLVKLDLLSVLSVMRYPKALDAVKGFLTKQTWGVTSTAAATLLEEGNEECLSLVEQLLKDSDEKIRIQAAFILALLGSDPTAVKVLQESYARADRDTKLNILGAIGHVGHPDSIPFLLDILKEPFQVQRLVAASALIQCLYH